MSLKINLFSYCLKVWLTSVFLASLIVAMEEVLFGDHSLTDGLSIYFIIAIVSFFFSMPSVIMLWTIAYFIRTANMSCNFKKAILSAAAAGLTAIAFYLASEAFSTPEMIALAGVYYLVTLAGIWIYRFQPKTRTKDAPSMGRFSPLYTQGS